MEYFTTLNIKELNILLKSIWEDKLLLLLLAIYFYSIYEILTKKIPFFLLSTEFEKEIEKREFYIKIIFIIKELLSSHFILLLVLIPIFYYFLKEYGIFYTILFTTLLFYLIKIIDDITLKTVNLHNIIFHNYELSIEFFGLFKERKNAKVFSSENNRLYFAASLIFVFINILTIILIIKFFTYAIIAYIIYAIIVLLFPKDIILQIIQHVTKKEDKLELLRGIYSFILGNLKNLRIVVLLFTLFIIFYIYSLN